MRLGDWTNRKKAIYPSCGKPSSAAIQIWMRQNGDSQGLSVAY